MRLNLPILEHVAECKNILIAGMGGGFDVFCGLPIYFELQDAGYQVHLANFSFADIQSLKHGIRLSDTLVGVSADHEKTYVYFPEYHLVHWFKQERKQDVTIWCFHKTGAKPLADNYRLLIDKLNIDCIVLVDGGVDSLMRGDEAGLGTVLEDSISLIAIGEQKHIQHKLVAAVAFGAEQDIAYTHVLENIASLSKDGALLGTCSLTQQMSAYQRYEQAVTYVHEQPLQDTSVINASIISSVRGEYGDYHLTDKTRNSTLWINPFMSIYWFFEHETLARHNQFYEVLRNTEQITDAYQAIMRFLPTRQRRSHGHVILA
jgi:hypothetical protein